MISFSLRQVVEFERSELSPVGSLPHPFLNLARCAFLLYCSVVCASCVSTRVEYFTNETYPSRETTAPVEWLSAEPTQPYIKIARISVDSTSASPDTLRQAILDRARRLGADAIIDEKAVIVASRTQSPNYEPGVLGPKGASFGLYGYGWYTPYSSDPYVLTQGATDQPRLDEYFSAVAIRYQQAPTPDRSQ
jgi:hypothetical protein